MGLGEAEDEVIGGTLRDWKWFIAIPNINTESNVLNIDHLYISRIIHFINQMSCGEGPEFFFVILNS